MHLTHGFPYHILRSSRSEHEVSPLQELHARVQSQLKNQDARLTKRRKAILEVLAKESGRHLSADEIYLTIKDSDERVGLATVYRTLELFTEAGIIRAVDFGDGFRRFELMSEDADNHHHLICLGCGKIIEVSHDLLANLEQRVEEIAKFSVIDHSLRFYGYCEECQEKHD